MIAQDRRRCKRYETENVRGSLHVRSRVEIVNISLTGLAVEARERLDVDRVYQLRLRHDQETLDLVGKVVWCRLATTEARQEDVVPVYRAGIEFGNVLQEGATVVRDFIEHNAVLTLDQRIFARFQFRTEGTVELDTDYDIQVKSLGLRGMCIETELAPALQSLFDMTLDFPESSLQVQARVVHTRPISNFDGKHPLSELGVEFANLPVDSEAVLSGYIREELEAWGPEP